MLSETLRIELKDYLHDSRLKWLFGDGLESEYIMDGVSITGLNDMDDEELLEEYERDVGEDDELLLKCQLEIAMNKLLTKE